MSLAAELENCLTDDVGCRSAALVDLDAGLMLAQSGGAPVGAAGEVLAAAACELLGRARPAAFEAAGTPFDHAVVAATGALHVFQRLGDAPALALCLSFDEAAAPDAAVAHARRHGEALAAAGLW